MSHKEDAYSLKELYKEALLSIAVQEGDETSREWARRMIDMTASPNEETSAVALNDAIIDLARTEPPQRT